VADAATTAGAAAEGAKLDPIDQFQIHPIVSLHLFGYDISLTNSALFMLVAVAVAVGFLTWAMSRSSLVPTRAQSLAEMSYEFIAKMVDDAAGEEGRRFFPLVFTIFMFIFTCNMLGMIPYGFTVTSHIIITVALALMVFATVLFVGFWNNGLHFLKMFVPSGVPIIILPFVVLIEIISFVSRPLSHSVRLFANMLAGHITLKVFGGFVAMLLAAGGYALLAPLPLAMGVALMALEFLVAFLQAYVFTMLTCAYLNDALHPGGH
jgi:F-type H+-transporting ATPase subunit a